MISALLTVCVERAYPPPYEIDIVGSTPHFIPAASGWFTSMPHVIAGYVTLPKDRWMRMDEDRLVGDTPEVSGLLAETLVGDPL